MPRLPLLLLAAMVAVPAFAQGFASDTPPARGETEPVVTAAAAAKTGAASDLSVSWNTPPQWLEGVAFAGSGFNGGAYYGRNWFAGSTITATEDVPIEIVFDRFDTSSARVWRRDQGYANGGVGTFNGAAFDVSDPANPRRLNVTFVEDPRACNSADGIWAPGSDTTGCREYLYIMASDYDGDGSTYTDAFGFDLDVLYVFATRVPSERALFESNPATLAVDVPPVRFFEVSVPSNGLVQMATSYTPRSDLPANSQIVFEYTPDGRTPARVGTTYPAGPTAFEATASLDGLDPNQFYTFRSMVEDSQGTVLFESTSLRLQPLVALNSSLVGVWNERGSWADVWGYTAPNGTEYALVALQSFGLSIVDISGSTPTEVGFIPTEPGANDSKDVKVIGDHAYLVNEVGPIQIVSLADPTAPQQVGLLDVQPGTNNGGAHNLSVDDQYLYVTGGRQAGNAGVRIYSVENPAVPTFVGEYRPDHFIQPYYHDFYIDGDIGYGPNIYGGGVDILDLSNRSNPTRISTFGYPGSGAHNVCGTVDGDYIYIGDEIGSSGNWTRIFDVRDPLNVELEGDIIVDPNAVVHNCYVVGDLLHIGHYTEGYRVFNVSDPVNPTVAAVYDTFLEPEYGFGGVWSIYPFFDSGRIAVSDRNGGLFVIELDDSVTTTEPPVVPGELDVSVGPNPTSGRVVVRTALSEPGPVRLRLLDLQGREIRTVFEGEATGLFRETVQTGDLAPGTYLLRLDTEAEALTRPFTVVR
ncbi:MAG: choice-of-anchor B family protein [Bacteroidota bacterium]